MFRASRDLNKRTLLQGDILKDVQIFGAINPRGIVQHIPVGTSEATAWSVSSRPAFGHVMVLSHSCEVDPGNNVKVTSIILAPLRDVNKATDPNRVDELIRSNVLSDGVGFSYLKYFYVQGSGELEFAQGAVVDYSKLFSVRNKAYDYLLERKVLELTDDAREAMSLKLAVYFHRTQNDTPAF